MIDNDVTTAGPLISAVNEDSSENTPHSADEIILRLRTNCKSGLAWGGMVQRKAGTAPVEPAFFGDESYYLVFVIKGVLKLRVNEQAIRVDENCALTILPGERCTWAEPNETDIQFLWLAYRVARSKASSAPGIQIPRVARVPDAPQMTELLRLLVEEYHTNQFGADLEVVYDTAVYHLLMSALARLDVERRKRPPQEPQSFLAEKARNYIRLNITSPITTSDVAKAVDCSTSYLGVVFQKAYGESILTFIQRKRVGMSEGLLIDTRMSIGEIARMVGFPSLNYYSRIFRRYMGMTPSAFRMAHSHLDVTTGI